jgi:hypothetical protein
MVVASALLLTTQGLAQSTQQTQTQAGSVLGTVLDVNDNPVAGASVTLQASRPGTRRTVVANDGGLFTIGSVEPGIPYQVTISAPGLVDWTSSVVIEPGQDKVLLGIKLHPKAVQTTVDVHYSSAEIAAQQVQEETKQRILGIVPNFYVVYDHNAVPLTPKLKFKLALRTAIDPVTIIGVAMFAGIDQAGDTPNYGQGAQGYGKRVGSTAAGGFSDIMIGGAILPSLLHQDPRYFYKGTGTKKSRALYALAHSFVCKGDNGKWQPNYSSLGGDLGSAAIANSYYPDSDRGVGLTFQNFAIDTAERMVASLVQEFVLPKLTRRPHVTK